MNSMTTRELLARLTGVKRNGKGWLALCPAHDDHNPSLSITDGDNGRILLHCFAGCSHLRVCATLGIDPHALGLDQAKGTIRESHQTKSASRRIVATYDYSDEGGKLLFQVVRYEPNSA